MAEYLVPNRDNGKDVAIVFIHGFAGDLRKTWGEFPRLLAGDGRLKDWDIFSLGYASNLWFDLVGIWKANPDVDAVAKLLRTTALVSLKRYKSLALIAHSMGGLIVQRALVDDDQFASRVGHVFFFGTPSGGLLKAAFFKFWKRQLDNMAENGSFITELRDQWTKKFVDRPPSFNLWIVAGDQDEFVPRTSSLGPFPPAKCWVVPGDHLSIVKPADATNIGVQLVSDALMGNAAPAGPGNSARVAVETRDFYQAIDLLESRVDDLDERGLVQLALALEGVGRQADAIKVLEKRRPDYTDAMGVLAGRLKRRWLVERQRADAETARELYAKGFALSEAAGKCEQAFYHAINVAFMDLAYRDDHQAAKNMAGKALEHCDKARRDKWRLATEGEAHLILGNSDQAIESYRHALATEPSPREVDSMYQQAVRVASLTGDESAGDRLVALFRGGDL